MVLTRHVSVMSQRKNGKFLVGWPVFGPEFEFENSQISKKNALYSIMTYR